MVQGRKTAKPQWLERMGEAAIALAVAFLMLWLVPKLDPGSDVRTHATAKVQAALIGGFYPVDRHKDITVLLIDDESLADLGLGWPVPYLSHARWLRNLGGVYKPRAIFLDITFTQERADDTLPKLVQALCGLRDRGIPVFLAALPDANTGRLKLRRGLESPSGEPPCFTLVGVNYEPHKIDRLVWTYPLWSSSENDGSKQGEQRSEVRSAALAMAQDVGHVSVPRFDEPMALTWGVNNLDLPRYAPWCRQAAGGLREIPPLRLRAVWASDEIFKPICPYSRVLTFSDLKPQSEADEARLHDLMDGRYVMIGTALRGTNDSISSPVHGLIPGVFMHAMALDNLLTYHGRYKRALEWKLPPAQPLLWLGISIVLMGHLLHRHLWTYFKEKWCALWRRRSGPSWPPAKSCGRSNWAKLIPQRFKKQLLKDWTPQDPWWTVKSLARLLQTVSFTVVTGLSFIARKVLDIFLSTAIIMVLVVLAQRWFDVGALPLVDLVLMALVAGWLGWTRRVADFVFRRKPVDTSGE
jgi:hypothetical protein